MTKYTRLLSSYNSRKGQNRPKYLIFHTNGASNTSSPPSLINYIEGQLAAGNKSVTQPHHDVGMNGDDYTTLYNDAKGVASYRAEGMCISVETQDSGYNHVPLNNDPWPSPQFEALAQIAADLHVSDGVPLRLPTHPLNDAGVGWHSMWGYNTYSTSPGTYGNITVGGRSIALNNPWTTVVGKTCPGTARINQVTAIINRAKQLVGVPVPSPVEEDTMIYCVKSKGPASSGGQVYATDLQTKWHINGTQLTHYKNLQIFGFPVDCGPHDANWNFNPGFGTWDNGILENIPDAYVPIDINALAAQISALIKVPAPPPAVVDINAIAAATRNKFTEVPLK